MNTTTTNNKVTLQQVFEDNQSLNLKRLSEITNTCYQYLLKASKKPIKGEVYNPEATNYNEVETIIRRKIQLEDIDWAKYIAEMPVREPAMTIEDIEDNVQEFTLRGDTAIYHAVYRTATHIVFIAKDNTTPRVMNNDTFLHQGPKKVTK